MIYLRSETIHQFSQIFVDRSCVQAVEQIVSFLLVFHEQLQIFEGLLFSARGGRRKGLSNQKVSMESFACWITSEQLQVRVIASVICACDCKSE